MNPKKELLWGLWVVLGLGGRGAGCQRHFLFEVLVGLCATYPGGVFFSPVVRTLVVHSGPTRHVEHEQLLIRETYKEVLV